MVFLFGMITNLSKNLELFKCMCVWVFMCSRIEANLYNRMAGSMLSGFKFQGYIGNTGG